MKMMEIQMKQPKDQDNLNRWVDDEKKKNEKRKRKEKEVEETKRNGTKRDEMK